MSPHLSGTVSVFMVFMVSSGLLTLFDKRFVGSPIGVLAFGFLVGYFSDKALQKMAEVADTLFGGTKVFALLGHLPARLTAEQAAWVLNCQAHDMPILVSSRLLKPLGNPPPNGVKFFSTADVLELTRDRAWLVKVTNAVTQHWQTKNRAKTGHPPLSVPADGPSGIQAVRTAA